MCVMSTTRSTSTFEPSVPRKAVMVTTSSASARGIAWTGGREKNGGGLYNGGAGGGGGLGGSVVTVAGGTLFLLRLFVGVVNQFDDGDERIDCNGCWKNDGAGISAAGGFRSKASARATMLGPALLIGGEALGATTGGSLPVLGMCVHRDTSRGRKQMQNRKK